MEGNNGGWVSYRIQSCFLMIPYFEMWIFCIMIQGSWKLATLCPSIITSASVKLVTHAQTTWACGFLHVNHIHVQDLDLWPSYWDVWCFILYCHNRLRGRVVKGVGHLDHVWSYGVREVVSSIPDRGNIVGWVFHPTRWLVRFSHLNMPFLQNSEFI